MTKILHAGALSFGRSDPQKIESFFHEIMKVSPDLVIFCGGFTAHAKVQEFKAAQEFLSRLSMPVFCVAGSADVPWSLDPLKHFRKYISPMQEIIEETDDAFVVGINTSRRMVTQNQLQFTYGQYRFAPPQKARIFVIHHPLKSILWGAEDLYGLIDHQDVDVVLSGGGQGALTLSTPEQKHPALIGVGQAIEGYNILTIHADHITVEMVHWEGHRAEIFETLNLPRIQRNPEVPDDQTLG